jgi:hypothetical protein
MKKIIFLITVLLVPIVSNAQSFTQNEMNPEIFRTCAAVFTLGLVMLFILTMLKRMVDFRLKTKIVEKGIPENIVASILQTNPKEDRNINVKWFAILAGLGAAFIIINATLPLGFHSLAIMAFCIAASFLGYFLFIKYSEK